VWAVSLGNLSILSRAEQALDARIALLIPADEVAQLNALEVHIGSQASYDRLGILRPNIEALPRIWIAKDAAQRPAFIRLQYLQPTALDESIFRDVVVELKWATGRLTRVYTLINPNQIKREVQLGESLSLIATELADDFPGIQASQVMLALYRSNPKAFVSGSIHRLKAGEVLALPSANMASSISSAEANQFVRSALNDLTQGMAARSSNEVFLNRSDRTNLDTLGQDRLQVGSAQEESEASLNQAKRDEELIAQQKLLEQARERVAQLEKNVADLNQLIGKEKGLLEKGILAPDFFAFFKNAINQYGYLLAALVGLLVLLFWFIKPAKVSQELQAQPQNNLPNGDQLALQSHSPSSNQEPIPSNLAPVPANVQKLFDSINLDLDAPAVLPSKTSLDSQLRTSKSIPSRNDQQLRLNLAKSYIKIMDYATAKIILQELTSLDSDGASDILQEAKQLLLEIA
jgi:pilus assembly protein FimV